MSLATQISDLATAIGAKIKVATPITKHKVELFGLLPQSSSAIQVIFTALVGMFGGWTYPQDGASVNATSTWALSGRWVGTYSLVLYYVKTSNVGIFKVEISKNGGSSWTTLSSGIDGYNATTVGATVTYTAISIPEGSDVLLRLTVTGKNASSTAYYYGICAWEMLRTGS